MIAIQYNCMKFEELCGAVFRKKAIPAAFLNNVPFFWADATTVHVAFSRSAFRFYCKYEIDCMPIDDLAPFPPPGNCQTACFLYHGIEIMNE